MMQKDKIFYKVTCEQITPLGKNTLLEIRCETTEEVLDIMHLHLEHIQQSIKVIPNVSKDNNI